MPERHAAFLFALGGQWSEIPQVLRRYGVCFGVRSQDPYGGSKKVIWKKSLFEDKQRQGQREALISLCRSSITRSAYPFYHIAKVSSST